jgi:hypothetical protein
MDPGYTGGCIVSRTAEGTVGYTAVQAMAEAYKTVQLGYGDMRSTKLEDTVELNAVETDTVAPVDRVEPADTAEPGVVAVQSSRQVWLLGIFHRAQGDIAVALEDVPHHTVLSLPALMWPRREGEPTRRVVSR